MVVFGEYLRAPSLQSYLPESACGDEIGEAVSAVVHGLVSRMKRAAH